MKFTGITGFASEWAQRPVRDEPGGEWFAAEASIGDLAHQR